jgi:hypothetical protein
LAVLLPLGTAFAKGPPAQVTLEGPGLSAVTFADRRVLDAVAMGKLELWGSQTTTAPIDPALPSYTITRSWTAAISDRLRYYPVSDGTAVVQLESASLTGGEHLRGVWFAVSPASDQVLRVLLADPPPPPVERAPWWQVLTNSVAGWLPVVLLAVVGLLLIRSRREAVGAADEHRHAPSPS